MPAPETIKQLVTKFTENREAYRSGKYNEAQLRQQFLDPFFEALGWDIYNRSGVSPEYQDVKIEDSLLIEGATKAPDYTFRIGKERKFFVEAKKPAVDIQYDIHPAYQLKRYAWNAHLPLSILTDFEEFAVYNCKNKPNPSDSAATGRDLFYKYTDYVEKWDEIATIFSKDAVWKGSFDRFAESSKGKKGTSEVDDAILESIESWRKLLALNIALRNPQVADEGQLNFAVQMTIDRILFLRICEDRGIEPEEQFKSMLAQPGIYAQMLELFKRADMKYNSGLFHFAAEKGTSAADSFTPGLTIDDKVLKEIIKDIYYPCPYIFKEIPVEILGQVYEQFLGKVIRLTAGHQAKIEEKPEVRKAGGVYYTPKYIVDYIVENTVGKLLEDKTPETAADLKIVDPACGSGSFLLGAYQHLLDWNLKWYTANDPEKWARGKTPALMAASKGGWKLTTAKKKDILVNNIHGVDIDAQAVEVTKLSLLLKVLEEESGQLSLGLERVLPDLGRNIQCGNSLIGEDYFEGQLVVDEKERQRVNPFNWKSAFPSVFAKGGFDAVVGNPPYGFHQIHSDEVKPYLKAKFSVASGSFENYFLFYEKSIKILNRNGFHGFIVPITWLTIPSAHELRKYILLNSSIREIIWFVGFVFENAQVNTLVSIIHKTDSKEAIIKIIDERNKITEPVEERTYDQQKFIDLDFYIPIFETDNDNLLIGKLISTTTRLKEISKPCSGYNPYEVGKGKGLNGKVQTIETVRTKPYHSDTKLGQDWKPNIIGRNLGRYSLNIENKNWVKYGPWLAAPRDPSNYTGDRILVQEITGGTERRIIATFYKDELYYSRDVIPIKTQPNSPNTFYLLGLINSKLLTWYHHKRDPKAQKKLFPKVLVSDLENLPIKIVDFSKPEEVKLHDCMVALVERMLELHKRTPSTPQEQERLTRDIASTDREIDKLVYALYGLTDEEIRIVEGG